MTTSISKRTYSKLLSFIEKGDEVRANMILKSCKFLGSGCSRTAYKIHLKGYIPFVLKIEWKVINGSMYYNQNKREISTWLNKDNKYLPDIYDWDTKSNNFRWLEMEYLSTLRSTKDIPNSQEKFLISKDLGITCREIDRERHWGRNSKRKLKIIDFGF